MALGLLTAFDIINDANKLEEIIVHNCSLSLLSERNYQVYNSHHGIQKGNEVTEIIRGLPFSTSGKFSGF